MALNGEIVDKNTQIFDKGDYRVVVTKNDKGLFDAQTQTFNNSNNKWEDKAGGKDFKRTTAEDFYDINLKI